ncbi:hypothetical protein BH09MYX1_BH09MYX1_51470 [soil metagenome]
MEDGNSETPAADDKPAPEADETAKPLSAAAALEPPPVSTDEPKRPFLWGFRTWVRDYFLGEDPTLSTALVPLCFLAMALFTRNPVKTNFIFDEQEALLANPYVRSVADPASKIRWIDAFHRDFWGLTPDRTIGSYRPLPDLVWRLLWAVGARDQTPFLHHWVNVLLHGLNGALMVMLVLRWTKDRKTAWLAGAIFTASAVLTEAIAGVVGLADVLGTLGALLALMSLQLSLPFMPFALFGATLIGLYSKESALCIVPLVPVGALLLAHLDHPKRPLRVLRMLVASIATLGAFVLYVEARKKMFPTSTPPELLPSADIGKGHATKFFHTLLRWYAQPGLPKDPLNNPLVDASPSLRIAGALRVYARGIGQVLLPVTLSGDYSAPQEPIPSSRVFPESILGGLLLVGPPIAAIIATVKVLLRDRKRNVRVEREILASDDPGLAVIPNRPERALDYRAPIIALGCLWMIVSYFPVSNIPIVLPTVRAERFWYFPVIGTSMILALAFAALFERFKKARRVPVALIACVLFGGFYAYAWRYHSVGIFDHIVFGVIAFTAIVEGAFRWRVPPAIAAFVLFLAFQSFSARRHANDYSDDLVFWDATRHAVPNSSKAALNYSVMQGARGNMEERRVANVRALELAPEWPMASVYLGDTLCRMHRVAEAWPHYKRGFDLGPNDINLIALGLQCIWDEGYFETVKQELAAQGADHPGSWLNFLQDDMALNGTTHNGVDPKYRPRGYNEGPKE